jgi:hypothetical protein
LPPGKLVLLQPLDAANTVITWDTP